jgi:type VI secretion system protein ImpH
MNPASAFAGLLRKPQRFRFDAGVRLLQHATGNADPAEAVRFRSVAGLSYAAADLTQVQEPKGGTALVSTPMMGLTGATGVLPRYYTEVLGQTLRDRSKSMHEFLDMLSTRLVGHFARAGIKYRLNRAVETGRLAARDPNRAPGQPDDAVAMMLLAFTGYGTTHLRERLAVGTAPLLHYAGLMGMRPRSADRLAALVSDWLGRTVEVEQFAGMWLELPVDQRTRLAVGRRAGQFTRLGVDAAIGVRAWDVQARVILRIGPLDLASFAALLPDRTALRRLVSLVRAYLGLETGFAVNLVLARDAVPALVLGGGDPAPRLGWTTWLPAPGLGRQADAREALFEANLVEKAEQIA